MMKREHVFLQDYLTCVETDNEKWKQVRRVKVLDMVNTHYLIGWVKAEGAGDSSRLGMGINNLGHK